MERRNECIELRTVNPTHRIALRGVRLHARLSGMSLKARLEQTFVNREDRAIEAVYTFPLIEGAAVCGFEVVTGDRVLTGKVEETGDAIEKYERAVSDGHGAYMAEQERPDVFTIRVGNLKPRQAATIRLTFVAPLEIADKAIRVVFPTTVAPRYVSAAGATDPLEAQIDGEALNPPHVLHVPYGLSMEVEVALGRIVRSITSPTHAVTVKQREDGSSIVSFAGGIAEMDRDVVLSVATAKEQQPCLQVSRGPDEAAYVAVTFVPDFHEEDLATPQPSETIFVLDCSGSMQGESIQQATAALELCLRSLSEGDTFNICRFGSSYELMSSEPMQYNSRTLKQAIQYVRRDADLGGTELYAPLQAIFEKAPAVGGVRQLILLTDGQISNEPAVIDLARKARGHNRIFSFGIGSACSAHLVKGLARATGGAAEFITGAERIEDKVLRTFGRIGSPQVSDVRLDWGNAEVQTLAEMPPVFDGEILTVFGRCSGALPHSVALQCNTPHGQRTWAMAVPPVTPDDGVIATMWARRTIQSLEEVNGVRRTSVSDRRENRARQEMIRLSKDFGMLCGLTTFITVEHRSLAERNEGMPETRKVPTMLAAGWGAVDAAPAVPPGYAAAACGGVMSAPSLMPPCTVYKCATPAPANAPAAPPADHGTGLANLLDNAPPTGRALPSKPAASRQRFLATTGKKKSGGLGGVLRKLANGLSGRGADKTSAPESPKFEAASELCEEASSTSFDGAAGMAPPQQAIACQSDVDPLSALLSQQSAEGYFEDSNIVNSLYNGRGLDVKAIEAALTSKVPTIAERDRVATTLLVLYLFKIAFADRADLWKRASRKAMHWLAKTTGVAAAEIEAAVTEATAVK